MRQCNEIGVALSTFGPTQISFHTILALNELFAEGYCPYGFYETVYPTCLTNRFSTLNFGDAWDFQGDLVVTNLNLAERCLPMPGPKRKWFYVWDLEWVTSPRKFRDLQFLYRHSELRIIARSDEHARLVENCWGSRVYYTVPDISSSFLKEIIHGD